MGGATVSVRVLCFFMGDMWRGRDAYVQNIDAANSPLGTARAGYELLRIFVYRRRAVGGTVGRIPSGFDGTANCHHDVRGLHGPAGIDYGCGQPAVG